MRLFLITGQHKISKGRSLMEPLKQWVCDVCGKIIETPDDGYVVWGENAEGKIDKIRI